MIADIAHIFAFTRQWPEPFQFPGVAAAIGVIFDVCPDAKGDAVEFIADGIGIADGVLFAADFDPLEIITFRLGLRAHPQVVVIKDVCPLGREEGTVLFWVNLAQLQEQRITHGLAIGDLGGMRLTKFVPGLTAPAGLSPGEAQDRVARAVGELLGFNAHPMLFGQMPSFDRRDSVARHFDFAYRTIQD